MPWQTKVHPESLVIETVYAGVLTTNELHKAVQNTLELASKHSSTKFLADCSALEGGHSILDLYELAHSFKPPELAVHSMREAVILPATPEAAEKVHFWENVCANRGATVKVFSDRDSALHWLLT